jgi:hypothetical protein
MHDGPVIEHHICRPPLAKKDTLCLFVIAYFGTYKGRPVEVVVCTDVDGRREFDFTFRDEEGPQLPRSVTTDLLDAIERYGFRDQRRSIRQEE